VKMLPLDQQHMNEDLQIDAKDKKKLVIIYNAPLCGKISSLPPTIDL